jgi:hypothetical protein
VEERMDAGHSCQLHHGFRHFEVLSLGGASTGKNIKISLTCIMIMYFYEVARA